MSAAHLQAIEPLILLLLIAVPVCALLAVNRAPWRQWRKVPAVVLLATVGGAILWTVLRSYLAEAVPGEPGLLYGAGLLFFLVAGIAVGALLSSRPPTVQVRRGTRISQRRRWPSAPPRRTGQAGGTAIFLDTGAGKGGHLSWIDLDLSANDVVGATSSMPARV